jgi:protease-4
MATVSSFLRNTFYLILIISFGAPFLTKLYNNIIRSSQPRTKVGYLEIQGFISEAPDYVGKLKKHFEDNEIKAIVVKIESPGGVAGSSQVIFQEILAMKKDHPKPIISVVENVCASGAYWIACATDHIIACPSAKIGSIGAFIASFRLNEFLETHKIHYESIKAGKFKNIADPFSSMTPENREQLQDLTNQMYEEFTNSIAERRGKLDRTKLKDWAEGRVFTGRRALAIGLIDELGTMSSAEAWLRKNAPIEGKIEWAKQASPSLWSRMFGQETETQEVDSSMPAWAQKLIGLFQGPLNRTVLLVG